MLDEIIFIAFMEKLKPYKNYFIVTIILLIGYCGLKIWESDAFQSYFYPKEYWQKEVEISQESIKLLSGTIRIIFIELHTPISQEMAYAINNTMIPGLNEEEERKIIIEEVIERRKKLPEIVKLLNENLEKAKEDLEMAERKLREHGGMSKEAERIVEKYKSR